MNNKIIIKAEGANMEKVLSYDIEELQDVIDNITLTLQDLKSPHLEDVIKGLAILVEVKLLAKKTIKEGV